MLAEIFMLRLETASRNVGAPPSSGDRRFVPIKLPINRTENPSTKRAT